MEVADAGVYPIDGGVDLRQQGKAHGRRWLKHWVPQDTVLGPSKCFLLKWVTEDSLNFLTTRDPAEEEQEPQEEHEIVYLCTFEGCGKIFPEPSGLRKHAHVHGEKQFICHYEGCGKRFVDSSKLKRHFLIHTGEKHFVCPFEGCGKAFSLDFNLRSHMRTHTGENYHICPFEECGKRYAHEYKLRAHLRTYHDKNIPEPNITSPLPEPEREVIVPKFVPPSAVPGGLIEKPYGCPFEGCPKRYIHEYKLNLHLKNAHLVHDVFEEGYRPRGGSEGEDEIEEGSDQELREYEEAVPRYYEPHVPKVIEPAPPPRKRRAAPKASGKDPSGKGKLRMITKPAVKSIKRKRANAVPVEVTTKLPMKPASVGRTVVTKREVAEDSEETEDEDRENTEEEDNVQQMGRGLRDEDDEETEDDMD